MAFCSKLALNLESGREKQRINMWSERVGGQNLSLSYTSLDPFAFSFQEKKIQNVSPDENTIATHAQTVKIFLSIECNEDHLLSKNFWS